MKHYYIFPAFLTAALLYVVAMSYDTPARAADPNHYVLTQTPSGEGMGQAQPLAEFFQLSFPLEQRFNTYSSHMDHNLPNYTTNGVLRPYTGEIANTTPVPTVES